MRPKSEFAKSTNTMTYRNNPTYQLHAQEVKNIKNAIKCGKSQDSEESQER